MATYENKSSLESSLSSIASSVASYFPNLVEDSIENTVDYFSNYNNISQTRIINQTIFMANESISRISVGSDPNSMQLSLVIPLYVIIFLLSVLGNILVVLTLVKNKRMRTVTNIYLINLVSFYKLVFKTLN